MFDNAKGVTRPHKSPFNRGIDNTMAKRKPAKGQTMIYKKIIQKTTDGATRSSQKTGGEPGTSGRVSCSCSTTYHPLSVSDTYSSTCYKAVGCHA